MFDQIGGNCVEILRHILSKVRFWGTKNEAMITDQPIKNKLSSMMGNLNFEHFTKLNRSAIWG